MRKKLANMISGVKDTDLLLAAGGLVAVAVGGYMVYSYITTQPPTGVKGSVEGVNVMGTVEPGPITVDVTIRNTGTVTADFAVVVWLNTGWYHPHITKADVVSTPDIQPPTGVFLGSAEPYYPDDFVSVNGLAPGAEAILRRVLNIPPDPLVTDVLASVLQKQHVDLDPMASKILAGVITHPSIPPVISAEIVNLAVS